MYEGAFYASLHGETNLSDEKTASAVRSALKRVNFQEGKEHLRFAKLRDAGGNPCTVIGLRFTSEDWESFIEEHRYAA